jgi:HEPN domain-containing protein
MKPIVEEWVKKAEGDWQSANRELRARKYPNYDAACFHGQQCAEKYLKAFLQSNNQRFPKTHHLIDLMELCLRYESSFELYRHDLSLLNQYAILFRYPGEEADKREAKEAINSLKIFRKFIRALLKLKDM